MKIKSVYISAFGKLEDASYDFRDGLNVIYGENEKGKTTLMNFIKMMFYGCDNRAQDLRQNLRRRYAPLSGKQMAGSIIFEQNGKEYKIERTFGSSASTDKITVTDLASGEREKLTGSTDLGLKYFGLTKGAFENCSYIGALSLGVTNTSGVPEINSKLSNLTSSGEEDVSIKNAEERLLKLKTFFRKPRALSGKLDADIGAYNALNEELVTADRNESLRASLNRRIEAQRDELNILSEKVEKIKNYLENTEKSQRRDRLEQFIKADRDLKLIDTHLTGENGEILNKKFISELEDEIAEIKRLNEKLTETENSVTSLNAAVSSLSERIDPASGEETERKKREIKALQEKSDLLSSSLIDKNAKLKSISAQIEKLQAVKPKINPLYLCLSIAFAVLSLISAFIIQSVPLFAAGIVLTVGFAFATALLKKDSKPDALSSFLSQRDELIGQISDINDSVSDISSRLKILNEDLVKSADSNGSLALLNAKKEELNAATKSRDLLKTTINSKEISLLNRFAPYKRLNKLNELQIVLLNMKSTIEKQIKAEMHFNMLKEDLGNISVGEAKLEADSLAVAPDDGLSYTKQDLEKCNNRISELNSSLAFDLAKARTDFRFIKHPTSIKREMEALSRDIKRDELYFNASSIALTVLNEASNETRKSFGGALEKRVTEIFSQITDNRYKYVSVSKSMEICVDSSENFGSIDIPFLSEGTADQAYFALRLAVAEFLSKDKERLPLFLDDSFASFDDNRAKIAFEFLKSYAKQSQVFFFTCHNLFNGSDN